MPPNEPASAHGDAGAKLGRMANQIADFFRCYPDDEAVAGVAQHIADFWTPSMRRALRQTVEEGGIGLDMLVVRAVRLSDLPAANQSEAQRP